MKYTLAFLTIALLTYHSYAITYIYVQNNSSLTFNVASTQTGTHILDPTEWFGMNGTISPWQRETEVLWSNRDSGIENGTDFFFTMNMESGGESFDLRMKLNGNFVGSDMWQSLGGPGFSHPWYADNSFHQETFTLGTKTFTVKYTAYFTGGDDDILFAIEEHDPFPIAAADLSDENVLNVLSYNIYMLTPPIAFTDQSERAGRIDEHVHGYDAIIINEAFDNVARDILVTNLSVEYPYYTDVVDEPSALEDGGVMIFSRWPIEYSEDIVYNACDDDDCLAAKGVMYARINKLGTKYHLFGTHMQAWADPANVLTRQTQMLELKNFVTLQNIPVEEAVILGGDFNVEKNTNFMNEYTDMFTYLNSAIPSYLGQPYTFNEDLSYYASGGGYEYLDYVMYEEAYRVPNIQTNNVIVLRSIEDDLWGYFDLSDHFAVQGRFVFPDPTNGLLEDELTSALIYPNPASDVIYLETLESLSNYSEFLIVDATGQVVERIKPSSVVSISELEAGMYFLHGHGGESLNVRFIKQ